MSSFYELSLHDFKALPVVIPDGFLFKKCNNCDKTILWDEGMQISAGTNLDAIENEVCPGRK